MRATGSAFHRSHIDYRIIGGKTMQCLITKLNSFLSLPIPTLEATSSRDNQRESTSIPCTGIFWELAGNHSSKLLLDTRRFQRRYRTGKAS